MPPRRPRSAMEVNLQCKLEGVNFLWSESKERGPFLVDDPCEADLDTLIGAPRAPSSQGYAPAEDDDDDEYDDDEDEDDEDEEGEQEEEKYEEEEEGEEEEAEEDERDFPPGKIVQVVSAL